MNPRSDPRCPRVQAPPHDPAKLPDPWHFDSESLLRELDRCREQILQIPTNGDSNATHFGIRNAVNTIWTLRENIRYLLHLHRDGQRTWTKRATQLSELQKPLVAKPTVARPAKARRQA
jgi:hypothetical protein